MSAPEYDFNLAESTKEAKQQLMMVWLKLTCCRWCNGQSV